MTAIEVKKMEVEYHKVYASRLDLELRVEELRESIRKLEDSINVQVQREQELSEKIQEAKKQ